MIIPAISGVLTETELARLIKLGDVLIPAFKGLPSLADTPAIGATLQRTLRYRPDLVDDLRFALKLYPELSPLKAAEKLHCDQASALSVIGTVVSAAYLMTPEIRALIGYPGQERIERDWNALVDFQKTNLLEGVKARGTVCRPTPTNEKIEA